MMSTRLWFGFYNWLAGLLVRRVGSLHARTYCVGVFPFFTKVRVLEHVLLLGNRALHCGVHFWKAEGGSTQLAQRRRGK
jgi:hypothetical protein